MADTAWVNSPDDDTPKPPNRGLNSWILTAAAGLIGFYFLVSGALMMRDKHGDGVFALIMIPIVLAAAAIAVMMVRSYRAERSARR